MRQHEALGAHERPNLPTTGSPWCRDNAEPSAVGDAGHHGTTTRGDPVLARGRPRPQHGCCDSGIVSHVARAATVVAPIMVPWVMIVPSMVAGSPSATSPSSCSPLILSIDAS